VPQVVHGDDADLVVVTDAAEGTSQVAWLDRQAAAGGEDQAARLPGQLAVVPIRR